VGPRQRRHAGDRPTALTLRRSPAWLCGPGRRGDVGRGRPGWLRSCARRRSTGEGEGEQAREASASSRWASVSPYSSPAVTRTRIACSSSPNAPTRPPRDRQVITRKPSQPPPPGGQPQSDARSCSAATHRDPTANANRRSGDEETCAALRLERADQAVRRDEGWSALAGRLSGTDCGGALCLCGLIRWASLAQRTDGGRLRLRDRSASAFSAVASLLSTPYPLAGFGRGPLPIVRSWIASGGAEPARCGLDPLTLEVLVGRRLRPRSAAASFGRHDRADGRAYPDHARAGQVECSASVSVVPPKVLKLPTAVQTPGDEHDYAVQAG